MKFKAKAKTSKEPKIKVSSLTKKVASGLTPGKAKRRGK